MFTMSSVRKFDNLKLAYRRLLTNPESTYKNYFRDVYTSYAMASNDNLQIINHKLKAGYIPNESIRVFMPKSNGLNRMYTLLSIEDQIIYQAFANIIAEATTNSKVLSRYKKSVFGNLYAGHDSPFFYQLWQDSYKAYTKAVIKSYQSGNDYIASFDLTACYDSINHSLLKQLLMKYNISENCVDEFIRLMGIWEAADGLLLGTGIPQGPQASGVIAEVVLSEYDSYVEDLQKKYNFKYFRYVDDIKVLAKSKEIVEWILFLLDKKSKELGLFPQAAKIAVHKILDINDEVKRISKPLFDDDFGEKEQKEYARKSIAALLRKEPVDLTNIKRYFHFVEHSSKMNKVAINVVNKYPNMIHSFAYYIQRYPRKIPSSITNYIYACCHDKTKQFSAGILLESIVGKLSKSECDRFGLLAKNLIKEDKQNSFIVDCRFKSQLIVFWFLYGRLTSNSFFRMINKENNWWIKKQLVSQLHEYNAESIEAKLTLKYINDSIGDISLMSAINIISNPTQYTLPAIKDIAPLAQNSLKAAQIICRSRYTYSQINKYVSEIVCQAVNFPWKKKLAKEHDQLELSFFRALCYWKTDLTAFVNLWDTIDDRLTSVIVSDHPELGGYTLGKIGGIVGSRGFIQNVPNYYKMIIEIHKLRLKSHLSHSKIKNTNEYTGPILYSEKKKIQKLIKAGISELISFW